MRVRRVDPLPALTSFAAPLARDLGFGSLLDIKCKMMFMLWCASAYQPEELGNAGMESHAGQVFTCVGALALADSLHLLDRDLLCWW